jgi:hypothetical protein
MPKGVYKRVIKRILSEETKSKISKSNKGKIRSSETKSKLRLISLEQFKNGMPNETKIKIGKALSGRKFSGIHKNRLSQSLKGRKKSKEHIKSLSLSKTGTTLSNKHKSNIGKSLKGHKVSLETKKKLSIANSGNKNWNWRGGLSKRKYPKSWTNTLRTLIRERDKYTCQICGFHQSKLNGWSKKLSVHHIDYNKKNCNPDNLITLCKSCHTKTNHNRKYWIKYFKILCQK